MPWAPDYYVFFDEWYQKGVSRGIAPCSNECGSLSHCARFVFSRALSTKPTPPSNTQRRPGPAQYAVGSRVSPPAHTKPRSLTLPASLLVPVPALASCHGHPSCLVLLALAAVLPPLLLPPAPPLRPPCPRRTLLLLVVSPLLARACLPTDEAASAHAGLCTRMNKHTHKNCVTCLKTAKGRTEE